MKQETRNKVLTRLYRRASTSAVPVSRWEFAFILMVLVTFIGCAGISDVKSSQSTFSTPAHEAMNGRVEGVEDEQKGFHPVFGFYERFISPVDGDRCPMHPTCSAYAKEAVGRHGVFVGWVMAWDRLVRCGRDETRISPKIIKDKSRVTLDPVSANDFWWYKRP